MKYLRLLINKGDHLTIKDIDSLSYCDRLFTVYYDDRWLLKIKDSTKIIPLKPGKIYHIKHSDILYDLTIYVYGDNSFNYQLFDKRNILISDKKGHFILDDPFLKDKYLLIKDNSLYTNDNGVLFVNKKRYQNESLNINDVINYLNFEIIVLKDHYLISDNYKNTSLKASCLSKTLLNYDDLYIEKQYLKEISDVSMRYELKEEKTLQKRIKLNIISIAQNVFMSSGMLVVGIVHVKSGNYVGEYAKVMLLMPSLMVISALVFPFLQFIFNKYNYHKDKKEYLKSILAKVDVLKEEIKSDYHQKQSYNEQMSFKGIFKPDMLQRRKDDKYFLFYDFGRIKQATGLQIKNDIELAEVKKEVEYLLENYSQYDGHLILDLKEVKVVSIICNKTKINKIIDDTIARLCYWHDYRDLKIVLNFKDINYDIKAVQNLKHLLDNHQRLIHVDIESLYDKEYEFVVLTDEKIEVNKGIIFYFSIDNSIHHKSNLIIDHNIKHVDYNGKIYSFDYDFIKGGFLENLSKYKLEKTTCFKRRDYLYNFEIYKNQTIGNNHLLAYLGNDKAGKPLIYPLDVGVHGLISGTTGSGKSYFIIALLLHLLACYKSDELVICLIDYKGSGIEKAISLNGEKPPHLVLSLNNIDQASINRSICALRNECKKREKYFEDLASVSLKSIMKLSDYNTYAELYNFKKLPYVLVVVDEFAELKSDRPEFISDLISISRIGRSLGMMLILSTQKAATAIDNEIISNVGYKIVLKVRTKQDSQDLIHTDLAYYLSNPGSFYIEFDNSLNYGQAYNINDDINGKHNQSLVVYDEALNHKNTYYYKANSYTSIKDRLLSLIDFRRYDVDRFYLDKLEKEDYPIDKAKGKMLLGKMDDYQNIKQMMLSYPLDKHKLLIYYKFDSSFKELLNNIIIANIINDNYNHIILIDDEAFESNYEPYLEHLTYRNEDIIYLNSIIAKEERITVVIKDLKMLYDSVSYSYIQELLNYERLIAFNHMVNTLRGGIIKYFNEKIILDEYSKDLSYLLFDRIDEVSENNVVYYDGHLVGFKMFDNINLYWQNKKACLGLLEGKVKVDANGFYFGTIIMTREPFYLTNNDKICFVAEFDVVFEKIKKAYPELKVDYLIYDDYKLNIKEYDYVIWFGVGLSQQMAISIDCKKELLEDEAYVYEVKKRSGYRIKYALSSNY